MNPNEQMENQEETVPEIAAHDSLSIDEFIKELEAKEKDLHISSDWEIEVEESDFDDTNPPGFIKQEFGIEPVAPVKPPTPSAPIIPPAPPVNNELLIEMEMQLQQLRRQITRMEAERFELSETMRRRQTDFDNFKTRIDRERQESFVNQVGNLAKQLLPVLDNLNRALDFAAVDEQAKAQDFQQFFEGIALVNQQLNEVLADMGVTTIAAVGEIFDPHYHEAVAVEASNDCPANTITEELLRGYRIGDKIIRAAMVKVATAARPAVNAVPHPSEAGPAEDLLETE